MRSPIARRIQGAREDLRAAERRLSGAVNHQMNESARTGSRAGLCEWCSHDGTLRSTTLRSALFTPHASAFKIAVGGRATRSLVDGAPIIRASHRHGRVSGPARLRQRRFRRCGQGEPEWAARVGLRAPEQAVKEIRLRLPQVPRAVPEIATDLILGTPVGPRLRPFPRRRSRGRMAAPLRCRKTATRR